MTWSAWSLGSEARQILEQLPDMNRADVIELGEVDSHAGVDPGGRTPFSA
jgi:hypothetical protein